MTTSGRTRSGFQNRGAGPGPGGACLDEAPGRRRCPCAPGRSGNEVPAHRSRSTSGRVLETASRILGAALLAALTLALVPAPVRADQGEATEDEGLQRRVEALEDEIAELRRLLEQAADGEAGESPDQRVAELQEQVEILTEELERLRVGRGVYRAPEQGEHGLGPAASKVYHTDRGVSIGGYGEMLYQDFASERDDGTSSGKTSEFDFLRAVFYFGYKFNDRILLNTEIEYEHASTDEDGSVSVEFAYLDFLFRDEVNVRAGLVLLPVGFLNELHEPPIFLSARRPATETVLIPTTWRENGVGVFGDLGPVSYRAYVVNSLDAAGLQASSGLRGGRQKGSKALAADFGLTARFDWTIVPGLLVGVSGFAGNTGQDQQTPDGETVDGLVRLAEFHAEWEWRGLEARALVARVALDDAEEINALNGILLGSGDSMGERMTGGYLEAGYDVLAHLPTSQTLVPFARYERYDTQARVPSGFARNPANDVEIWTLGVAYRPIPQVVVKVDYQDIDNAAGTGTDQLNVALGYLF